MSQSSGILLASEREPEVQKLLGPAPGLKIEWVRDGGQLLPRLREQSHRLLITDLAGLAAVGSPLGEGAGMKAVKQAAPQIEVLLLAAAEERQTAIQLLGQGAADYILWPVTLPELQVKVTRLLEQQKLRNDANRATEAGAAAGELTLLHEASREISQTLDLGESLATVLARVRQFTEAHKAYVFLVDAAGNLSPEQWVGSPPPVEPRPLPGLFDLARQTALSQKISNYPEPSSLPGWTAPFQSLLFLPMLARDKLIGVLILASEASFAFSDSHIRWLSIFCDQAAIAIENAYLFQNLSSAYIDLAQSREQILHSRNTLQVLFDSITDGLTILDQELTISAINQVEAERQAGQPQELVGKSCLSLDWAVSAPELLNQIRAVLQTGQKTTWISPENRTEPNVKDREFRIYPIRNRLAQTEQVVVWAEDVSERRRWQASLFRSANLAAVGQLAGSVAHQINNPLTVTMANSQLILLDAPAESETYELALAIFKAGERIQNIVTNLLEFSNQETYVFVLADLVNTIEGALGLVFRSLKKAGVEIIKDYQVRPVLPASVSHLKLVWMNLLLNARDAVMDHAAQPQVIISTRAVSPGEVAVTITDNGIGIAEKDFEQLFRPFFTTKPVGQAIGLGLYSAHTIVERHRGQIKVSSQPGVATTFEVILPLESAREL